MRKTFEKILTGVFFFVEIKKFLPDEYISITKLFTLGGLGIISLYSAVKEYAVLIDQEHSKCWLRPLRISTPILKNITVTAFLAMEIVKIQIPEMEDSAFIQGCYSGFAVSLLMESIVTWQMANRRGERIDKWNSILSLLTSGALVAATIGKIEALEEGPTVLDISLLTGSGLCFLQTPFWGKKECKEIKDKIKDRQYNDIQGSAVPNHYRQPLLLS